ncbi:MAG: hypothetical protein ACRD1U_03450, partial [Vicinamibacterales bacterium]
MRPVAAMAAIVLVTLGGTAEAQGTRAELLAAKRAEKAADLRPYEPSKLEKIVAAAEEGRLRRLITPRNGFFAEYGYNYK